MKFLRILEKAWLAAILIAISLGLLNLMVLRAAGYKVYTPFICALLCVLIFFNIRRQRVFLENMEKEKRDRPA